MTGPDSLWSELTRLAGRAAPRFDPIYGLCDLCRLGATAVLNVGTVSYGVCEPDRRRWVAGEDILDGWFGSEIDEMEITLQDLATFDEIGESNAGEPGPSRERPIVQKLRILKMSSTRASRPDAENKAAFLAWDEIGRQAESGDQVAIRLRGELMNPRFPTEKKVLFELCRAICLAGGGRAALQEQQLRIHREITRLDNFLQLPESAGADIDPWPNASVNVAERVPALLASGHHRDWTWFSPATRARLWTVCLRACARAEQSV